MPSIFLSHSHKDKEFVRRLVQDLAVSGIRVWVDDSEIEIGEYLLDKISDALSSVDFVGVVLSSNAVDSEWVKREVNAALALEIRAHKPRVVPIVISDCAIPPFLQDRSYIDFRDASEYDKGLALLVQGLKAEGLPRFSNSTAQDAVSRLSAAESAALDNLVNMKSEELIAIILMVLFGAGFWQLDHILHWSFGLTFEQVSANPALSAEGAGEVLFDRYMGLAQLILLATGALPLFTLFKKKKYVFIAGLIFWPIIITMALGEWRHRHSIPGIVFAGIQSAVLFILVLLGSIRRDLISELGTGHFDKGGLATFPARISEVSKMAWIGGISAVILMPLTTITMALGPKWIFTWTVVPKEREALALLFILSAIFILAESGVLLWRRFEILGRLVSSLQRKV
jgi:TIR domain